MSASVAPASTTQTRIAPPYVTNTGNNQSESIKSFPSNQSADPRSANTLSPRQGDAILSLVSTDDSTASSKKGNGGSQSLSAANRAYHDTASQPKSGDSVLRPQNDEDDNSVTLPGISVGPGGSSDGGGSAPPVGGSGGTAPADGGGGGGGSAPAQGSNNTSSPGAGATVYGQV